MAHYAYYKVTDELMAQYAYYKVTDEEQNSEYLAVLSDEVTMEMALYDFFSTFDIPCYDENFVPADAEFPYLTYETKTAEFGDTVALTCSLWYRSESWLEADAKRQEIFDFLGRGGASTGFTGGCIWLKRGSPFSQRMGSKKDEMIKRIYINLEAEYMI